MAFTPEQEAAILEFVTKSLAAPTPPAAPATPPAGEEGKKPADDGKTITQQAKDAVEAEKAATVAFSQIQDSVKFNLSVTEFVEKNKSLLPEEAGKILGAVEAKIFKDENERANTVRKSLLDSFLEKKENVEILIPSMQARAEAYKALAESDKEKRSKEFWDLAEVGVALKAGARKAEVLKKINGGDAGDSGNILQSKLLAAADKKFNHLK